MMTGSRLSEGPFAGANSPGVQSGVDPLPVETVYGEISAYGWRYHALDGIPYERNICLLGGGFGMVCTGLLSAVGNSRRRRQAEALAAPQWRSLGPLRIAYTSERLLVWHRQAWWSVWLAAVVGSRWDPVHEALDLFFEGEAPYRLVGPEVYSLATRLPEPDLLPRPRSPSSIRSGKTVAPPSGVRGRLTR